MTSRTSTKSVQRRISCHFSRPGFGVAFVPNSTKIAPTLTRIQVSDVTLERTIFLYGVAGRQRTAVAGAMMKMLRAYDWSLATT